MRAQKLAELVVNGRDKFGWFDDDVGVDAKPPMTLAEGNEGPASLLLLSDGKIVASGNCGVGNLAVLCLARYDGGPFGYKNCSLDIDGDNRVLATTDSLIHARIALGITGNAVTSGISFPPTATRNTWPLIRDHLVTQCGMSLVQ